MLAKALPQMLAMGPDMTKNTIVVWSSDCDSPFFLEMPGDMSRFDGIWLSAYYKSSSPEEKLQQDWADFLFLGSENGEFSITNRIRVFSTFPHEHYTPGETAVIISGA